MKFPMHSDTRIIRGDSLPLAPFDPYGETERNHGSKYETATHYR